MDVSLRVAAESDAAAIEGLRVAGWRRAYRGIISDAFLDGYVGDVERRRDRVARRPPGNVEQVAVAEEAVLGWVAGGPSRDEDAAAPTGASAREPVQEVYACYVAPHAWGRGIGRALLAAAVAELAPRGPAVTLWVLRDNGPARRFYAAHGFAPDGAMNQLDLGGPVVEVRYRRRGPP